MCRERGVGSWHAPAMEPLEEAAAAAPLIDRARGAAAAADPWALANLALPVSSLASGFVASLASVPIYFYFYDVLGLGATQYYVYEAVMSVPSACVVGFGFLADCAPLCGRRCAIYLVLGRALFCGAYLGLALATAESFGAIVALGLLGAAGEMLASSMASMLVVDRTALEPEQSRGYLQATCLLAQYFGRALGMLAAAATYGNDLRVPGFGDGLSIAAVFAVVAVVPTVLVVPLAAFLDEPRAAAAKSVGAEARALGAALAEPCVLAPTAALVGASFLTSVDNT